MIKNWQEKYSENMQKFEGYSIGKTLKYLADPEIISLAGGLPSPKMFPKSEVRIVSEKRLNDDIDKIMQYSAIPGEANLRKAIIKFLKRDDIHIAEENLLITSSGQHGLDLTGRLFLNPNDTVMVDRPTFAGALVAFQMEQAKFIGIDIEADGTNITELRKQISQMKQKPKFIYVVPDK